MSEGQEKLKHTHGQTHNPQQPEMSKATREVLQRVRRMIPPMLPSFHKGMCYTTSRGVVVWGLASAENDGGRTS